MTDGFDRRNPNYLLGELVKATEIQSRQLDNMSEKLDKLAHVSEKLDLMGTEIYTLRQASATVHKHSVFLGLLGMVLVVGAPIITTWNFQLRAELLELNKITSQLEERVRRNTSKVPER